ncbi:hypothetical protein C8F01DRAFT_1228472 [Mycena amicta]|nr:hypothetical protein C8F01DRAFT_1228472 [Mycena amicta]
MPPVHSHPPPLSAAETIALLTIMYENKAIYQSGVTWNPKIWPIAAAAVNTVRAQGVPERTGLQCQSRITYLKQNFQAYCVVGLYSRTGWDKEKKHWRTTKAFQEEFFAIYSIQQYGKCFTKPCQYFDELYEIYDGKRCIAMERARR